MAAGAKLGAFDERILERRALPSLVIRSVWRFARTNPLGAFGGAVLIFMVVLALGADWIAPHDPLGVDPPNQLTGPSLTHPFGTDNLGRDQLSRVIHGARPSLYTGLITIFTGSLLGMLLGVISAYIGGIFDLLVQRIVDALLAFPGLILAMALIAVFSSGIHIWFIDMPLVWHSIPVIVVVVLSFLMIPSTARIVRGAALGIVNLQYVEAARVLGASPVRLVLQHIVPNVFPVVIVIATVSLGYVVLIEASLGFLGLGTPPPNPSWGGMFSGIGRQYFETAPWLAIFPGVAISLAVLGFNLFGDAMRDVLDPRLRQ